MIYIMLALFDVMTVSISLTLNHKIIGVYDDTVAVSNEWAARQNALLDIVQIATAMNAPGNDVFDTKDAQGERREFETLSSQFDKHLEALQLDLQGHAKPDIAVPILKDLGKSAEDAARLSKEADAIFSEFSIGNSDAAGTHMAQMDRAYGDLSSDIHAAIAKVAAIQKTYMAEQAVKADMLRKFEIVIALMIMAMVGGATFYGHRLAQEIKRDAQERFDTVNKMEKSETRLRAVLDTAVDGIITINTKGIVLSFNPAAERLFGYTASQVVGQNVKMLMPEQYSRDHDQYIGNYMNTGEEKIIGIGREVEAQRKDGSTFPIELGISVADFSQNEDDVEDIIFFGIIHDITERKESEQKLKAILDTVIDGIITIDERGTVHSFNPAAEDIFGYEAEEVIGQNVKMLMPDNYAREHDGYLHNYLSTGEAKVIGIGREVEAQRKDGSVFPIELGVNGFDLDGRKMFAGIIRDVSARKESEQKLKAILDTVIDGIVTINGRGIIQSFNPAAEELFGYQADEVIGQNVKMLMPENYSKEHDGYIHNYIETGDAKVIGQGREVEAQRKDGSTFPMELGVSAVDFENNGSPESMMFVGSIRDISARKQSEADMNMYLNQLEIAKMDADRANIMKSQFLATMSHEIRTPMNGVIGMTELLLETELNQRQKNYAKTVMNSAESLLVIINDILDFSKIEAGKMELEPVSFDLMQVVDEVADLMMPRVKEKTVELITRFAPGTPQYLIGDPVRIRQIITNLISNAVKFTEKGYVLVMVEGVEDEQVPEGHKQIKISIKDTGIGISEEAQAKLFEKFSQADASTTRKYGGTGLGLAICKELTQMMGGDVHIESAPGKGTTFWLMLTLPEDTQAESYDEIEDVEGLKDIRVLIVDDMAVNREILKERLEALGMVCDMCGDGNQALEKLRTALKDNPYQMAVLDYHMPGMNGDELARTIKGDPAISNTVLTLLSSMSSRGHIKSFREAGFSAFLTKPVRGHDLEKMLALVWKEYKGGNTQLILTSDQLPGAEREGFESYRFSDVHILVAEDNRTNQSFAIQILEDAGCTVTLAENGREAVEKTQESPPDLIFMDCEMPEIDGYEAAQIISEMKSDGLLADMPIVALTANTTNDDKGRSLAAGMCDLLSKPMRKKDMLGMVRKHLPDKAEGRDKAGMYRFDGCRVLLVEDNRTNRILAEELLEEMGFSFDTAENGQIACEKVREKSYDILLMDMQMPVMDGYDATKAIRALIADGVLQDMPIIALTANAMKGDREKCIEAGTNDYITKPVKKADLNSTIAKWLEPRSDAELENLYPETKRKEAV